MNSKHRNKPVKIKKHTTQDLKTKFRRSKAWKDFRDTKRKSQKVDPITGKPLSTTFNLHHCDLDAEHYTDITNPDKFIGLNSMSHDCVHFIYGDEKCKKDWKKMIKNLIEIMIKMDKYNMVKESHSKELEELQAILSVITEE